MNALLQQAMRSHEPNTITAQSGLKVDVTADSWQLLATTSKGWKFDMSWVWNTAISDEDRSDMLTVYSHYATSKAAGTTSTIVSNTKLYLSSGIPPLIKLRSLWSGLPVSHKKGLNQFFCTLCKLGYKQYNDYHGFTKANLDKEKTLTFDSKRGALSHQEFDSFCAALNLRLQSIDWNADRSLEFFQSQSFSQICRSISNKLAAITVRRPIQLSMLKWIDVIPVGSGFEDQRIDPSQEVGNIGIDQLQIRFFHAKASGRSWRTAPERFPVALNAQSSELIASYKRLYMHGVQLWLKNSGCPVTHEETRDFLPHMPMFPLTGLFNENIGSIESLRSLFTQESRGFHVNESAIAMSMRYVAAESSRTKDCTVTSNRIRHTVLTRGAQAGYTAATLAKITGVTEPAARHYIDLDYRSRRMIDELYDGSEFLAAVFSDPLERVSGKDAEVLDHQFNSVGGIRDKQSCNSCSAVTGRPIGCCGCNNFRPILEADHAGVLELAEQKLAANSKKLLSPVEKLSVEKLTKQVAWIKRTIDVCNQVLEVRRGVE